MVGREARHERSTLAGIGVTDTVGLDVRALEAYLAARVPDFAGRLRVRLLEGGRSNLTYAVTDGTHRWVLRRPPLGRIAPSANDVAREFRFISALARHGVPVPAPVACCADTTVIGAPFTVVSFVDGRVVRSAADVEALGAHAPAMLLALTEQLAALHTFDITHPEVSALGRPAGYLRRQIARWRSQWETVHTRPIPDVDRLHAWLEEHQPNDSAAALVHGDYRIDNVLFRPGDPASIAAVIDWEMAALGDPLADLGVFLAYWDPVCAPLLADGHPRLAAIELPDTDRLAQWYATAARRDLTRLPFYVAFGCFKLAVVAEGIHRRYLDGDSRGGDFQRVGEAVRPLAAAGLAARATSR